MCLIGLDQDKQVHAIPLASYTEDEFDWMLLRIKKVLKFSYVCVYHRADNF